MMTLSGKVNIKSDGESVQNYCRIYVSDQKLLLILLDKDRRDNFKNS